VLDAAAKVLLKEGQPVRVAKKAVETLLALVENAGQVVTKEQLIATVWGDRVVDEANLTQNIAVLRRALGHEQHPAARIETFPGRGYRITGPVELVREQPAVLCEAPARRSLRWLGWLAVAIAAGLSGWWFLARRSAPPAEFHRQPLTRLAGKEYQPAVSPDGKRTAFVWLADGKQAPGLWVQGAQDSAPKRISTVEGEFSSPAWAPDGRSLAYIRFGGVHGEIWISSLDGTEARIISRLFPTRYGLQGRHLDWSPDGRTLAVDDTESISEPLGLFLVDVATGRKQRLTTPDALSIGDTDPRFSPDGRTVAFIRVYHRVYQELFTVPSTGGTPTQITADGKQVSAADWLPGSRTLVFASDRDGDFRLWRAAATGQGQTQHPQPAGIYGDFPIQFSIARNAAVLVYSVLQHDLNIWRLALEPRRGGERWTRVVASAAQDASPQYSPDGRRISFRSDRSGDEQIWVAAADGSEPEQVTAGKLRPSVARWSPDGRSLVFNNPRTREIYIATNAAAPKWDIRPLGVQGVHPVFSHDGQWVYAGAPDAVIRVPSSGGPAARVWDSPGLSLGMSPDGRWLYFVREPAATSLWRLEIASGRLDKALDGLVPYCTSCWAPAQDGIYYLGAKPHPWSRQTVYFHDFASGRDRPVIEYPEPLLPIGSGPFSLSPDGANLLCVRVDPSNADIMRVEPFR
jgi:Tol biopolymer transport system component/DNA-binding winged helix-turn-helix (wHTH) protein